MKANSLALLLFPLLLSTSGCSSSKTPVDVIIMAGQSNMVGCSTYSGLSSKIGVDTFSEYQQGYSGVKIAYDCWTKDGTNEYSRQNTSNGKFLKSFLGQGNSDLTFGPEMGIAETFNESHAGKLFLIKYGCGASNLLDDWAAPSSGKKTTMYGNFVSYVQEEIRVLNDLGYDPKIKVMCWMQGEGDSYKGYYEEYQQQLTYFVTSLRDDLKEYSNEPFAFIDGGISDSDTWVYYKEVNEAKKAFAATSSDNVYIDTLAEGLNKDTLQSDKAHYQGEYMVKLGKLFANAISPFLSKL